MDGHIDGREDVLSPSSPRSSSSPPPPPSSPSLFVCFSSAGVQEED